MQSRSFFRPEELRCIAHLGFDCAGVPGRRRQRNQQQRDRSRHVSGAIRHIVDGDFREAGVETLAALAAPALMSYASTASLVMEVVDGAYSLVNPAMDDAEVPRFAHRKAA